MTFGLYLLLNLVCILFFGWWLRRLIVRRLEPERILADLEDEVRAIIQNLNAAGDQNVTLLEDRIADLRTLLQRADTQIDEVEYKLRTLEEEHVRRSDSSIYTDDEQSEPEGGEPLLVPFRRNQSDDVSPIAGENERNEQTPADIRRYVLVLHDQGLSNDLISARTGMAIGEVELIISLGTKRTRQ